VEKGGAMKTGIGEATLITVIMAAVILFCRACPFLFFREKKPDGKNGTADDAGGGTAETGTAAPAKTAFLNFVEKVVPPLAMTVLTFNALAVPIYESIRDGVPVQGIPVLIAAAFTVIIHLLRRNPLLSIFGGTAVFMVLERLVTGAFLR
jgi:branched-subunit amino acid transport protein AzlD